jgi:uncharacterized membrane protein
MKIGITGKFLIFFLLGLVFLVTLPLVFSGLPSYLSETEQFYIQILYLSLIIVFFMIALW